jgi:hypothetical protein
MGSKMDYCWRKAAEYTKRAEETTDEQVRECLYRLRDSWMMAANRHEELAAHDAAIREIPESCAPPLRLN